MSKVYFNEEGYIDLLRDILANGVEIPDRTGVGCFAVFDAKVVFTAGNHALSTIRPAGLRLAFEEMWFFLRGETDTRLLEDKGIFFWQGNTSREFLDKRGLQHLPDGDLGAAYSKQWRDFGGIDQLTKLLTTLEKDRYSRRMVVSLWNPSEEDEMPLTPCWWSSQYVVIPDKNGVDTLHVKLINRSLDTLFGAQFAMQQYRLFQLALCQMFGFALGDLSCDLSHVHLYKNQIEYTKELVNRLTGQQGSVSIAKQIKNRHDLLSLQWEDIRVDGHDVNMAPFTTPRPPMAV